MICLYFKEDLLRTIKHGKSIRFEERRNTNLRERTAASKQRDDSKCGRLRNPAYRGGCC